MMQPARNRNETKNIKTPANPRPEVASTAKPVVLEQKPKAYVGRRRKKNRCALKCMHESNRTPKIRTLLLWDCGLECGRPHKAQAVPLKELVDEMEMADSWWTGFLERIDRVLDSKPEPLNHVGTHKEARAVEPVVAVAGDRVVFVIAAIRTYRIHKLDETGDIFASRWYFRDGGICSSQNTVFKLTGSKNVRLWYLISPPKVVGSYGGLSFEMSMTSCTSGHLARNSIGL